MKYPERIEDYLQHIVEAIDHITGYVQEIDSAAALERDHMLDPSRCYPQPRNHRRGRTAH